MKISALVATSIALIASVQAAIPQATFDALKCAAGVGYTYSQNGCTKTSITDQCGKKWNFLNSFPISDGYGGTIIVRIFRRDDLKEIHISFPGSKGFSNIQADLNTSQTPYTFSNQCPSCMMHQGFLSAYLGGRSQIISFAKTALAANPSYALVTQGGSLGGALAALAFADLTTSNAVGVKPARGFSFGEPRVGNPAWAAFMNGLTGGGGSSLGSSKWQRVTHAIDLVPRIPKGSNWLHHDGEVHERNSSSVPFAPSTITAASTDFCALNADGSEPSDCVNAGFVGSAYDHLTYAGYGSEAAVC